MFANDRIDKLKEILIEFIFYIHDTIIDIADENQEWYDSFGQDIDDFHDKFVVI